MQIASIKVKARTKPRDIADIFIGIIPLIIFLVLPSLVVGLLMRSFGAGFITYVIIYFIYVAFTVWSLRLTDSGIQFVRLLGKPRFLRWDEIVDISEASRREVIIYGWLAPRFPGREMTPCLSTLRHFRIRWDGDYCYYPPHDADGFLKLIDDVKSRKAA